MLIIKLTNPDQLTNPKQWWKITAAQQLGTNKTKTIPDLLVNVDIFSDDIEKSNVLNIYFIDTSSLDPELNSQFLLEVNSIFNDALGHQVLDTFAVNPCEVLNV